MSDLRARLRRHILRGEGDFNALALALFAHQRQTNPDYAAFCAGAAPQHWSEIPAVPVALYRDLPLTTFPPEQATRTFLTSGTTGRRGAHRLKDTDLYDLGALRWAERCVGRPIPAAGISLVSHAPESSLGHMCRSFAPDLQPFFHTQHGLDVAGAWAALRAARRPVFVPGTAFAFAELLAAPGASVPCDLPEGSVLMVTGGFKGRRLSLTEADLYAALWRTFPTAQRVGEYGMTELSSQLWADPLGGAFVAPPWMRVCAVDPGTGAPTRRGLLRFVDLANDQTVLAIETRDQGELLPGNRVALLGRLPGGPPRGCSLTVEEASSPPPPPPAPPPEPDFSPTPTPAAASASTDAGDQARVAAVMRALAALRSRADLAEVGQGLSPEVARAGLEASLSAITAAGLLAELGTVAPSQRPTSVSVVCAQGVFAAPVEWAALYAAAGCRLRLKAPAAAPRLVLALADALAEEELLDVRASTSRDLGQPEAVVTFGDDGTLAEVRAAWPAARHVGYGHRFSVAWASGPGDARAVAADIVANDTRGCMAPAAVLVPQAEVAAFVEALAAALAASPPGGGMPAELGPEHRRRLGLARARGVGGVREGEDWAIACLPPADLSPATLPRLAMVHPLASSAEAEAALRPWRHQLSSLAAAEAAEVPAGMARWFPRRCGLGQLQRPPFPRRHDGLPMLRSVSREGGSDGGDLN